VINRILWRPCLALFMIFMLWLFMCRPVRSLRALRFIIRYHRYRTLDRIWLTFGVNFEANQPMDGCWHMKMKGNGSFGMGPWMQPFPN
jgi:hypothetical protein